MTHLHQRFATSFWSEQWTNLSEVLIGLLCLCKWETVTVPKCYMIRKFPGGCWKFLKSLIWIFFWTLFSTTSFVSAFFFSIVFGLSNFVYVFFCFISFQVKTSFSDWWNIEFFVVLLNFSFFDFLEKATVFFSNFFVCLEPMQIYRILGTPSPSFFKQK